MVKGYSLEGQRPVEVIGLSMGWKLVSRLQLIYLSWHIRYSPRPSALPGTGEIVGRIALSSSEFAANNNRADLIRQDQRGSIASHSENNRTRETANGKGINSSISLEDLLQCFGRKRKDAAESLGGNILLAIYLLVSTFNHTCYATRSLIIVLWKQYENTDFLRFFAHAVSESTLKRICRHYGIERWQNKIGSNGNSSLSS